MHCLQEEHRCAEFYATMGWKKFRRRIVFFHKLRPHPCTIMRCQFQQWNRHLWNSFLLNVYSYKQKLSWKISERNDCPYEKDYLVCNLPNKSKLHIVQVHVGYFVICNNFAIAIIIRLHNHQRGSCRSALNLGYSSHPFLTTFITGKVSIL